MPCPQHAEFAVRNMAMYTDGRIVFKMVNSFFRLRSPEGGKTLLNLLASYEVSLRNRGSILGRILPQTDKKF